MLESYFIEFRVKKITDKTVIFLNIVDELDVLTQGKLYR